MGWSRCRRLGRRRAQGRRSTLMKQPVFEQKKDRTILQSLRRIVLTIGASVLILSVTTAAQGWAAADEQQKTFSSPEAAAQAMVDALHKDDRPELLAIFGKDA